MRVYHGTVDAFLPAIQSEGLKYTPKHSFKMHGFFRDLKIEHGVYVSTTKQGAQMMALIKAIYLKSPDGSYIPGTIDGDWKDSSLQIDTQPVIVTLELPDDWNLKRDKEWADRETGWISPNPIPPEYIIKTEVTHL